MAADQKSVIFIMADYGHDPTETAVPFHAFKEAGFEVTFATENGNVPKCDERMLSGLTQKILGADRRACNYYATMSIDPAISKPLSWSSPDFSLDLYDLVVLPGGHEKGVRQVIESPIVHRILADYFPKTKKPSRKAIAAICHGVMVLSESLLPDGKSVIHDARTTALPGFMEQAAFWGTRAFLGDYYKTFGAGSSTVEDSVKGRLDDPGKQWEGPSSMAPFVIEDRTYNYVSGRFPPDADLLASKAIALVRGDRSL